MGLLPVLLGLAVSACGGESPSRPRDARLGQPFTLKAGESALLEGQRLCVTFDEVTGDSRCPRGVQCIWEGDAAVRLTVVQEGQEKATLDLHTAPRYNQEAEYRDFRVVLMDVAPYPKLDNAIPAAEYVATLKVETAR